MSTFYYIPGVGNVELTGAGALKIGGANQMADIAPDVIRDIGLQSEIQKNSRFAAALANPGDFLTARGTAMTNLATEINDQYLKDVIDLVKQGLSNEDATKSAKKLAEERHKVGLKKIEAKFPVNVEKLVKAKFENKI